MQFVARGRKAAKMLIEVLKRKLETEAIIVTPFGTEDDSTSLDIGNFKERQAVRRVLKSGISQAIIPTAGYGTRLFPASRSIRPKSLMPIVDEDGFTKPILLHLVEHALRSGVEDVVIVTAPGAPLQAMQQMFTNVEEGLFQRLKPHMRQYAQNIAGMKSRVQFRIQAEAHGFGHAVACGINESNEETGVVVLLGDVVFSGIDAIPSVMRVYEKAGGKSIVGTTRMTVERSGAYGVLRTGTNTNGENKPGVDIGMDVIEMIEKPSREQAKAFSSDGFCDVVLGPYVLSPSAIRALKCCVSDDIREGGEIQLTSALISTLCSDGLLAVRVPGDVLDTGNSIDYASAISVLAAKMGNET